MRRALRVLAVCAAAAVTTLTGVTAASAAPAGPATCAGGSGFDTAAYLGSGTYHGLTVSGLCTITPGSHVSIRGTVTLMPGAILNALTQQTMDIRGNIVVGAHAVLALGCTPAMGGCFGAGPDSSSSDTVQGNIVAKNAMAMYLNGDTVYGNVSWHGGGWGPGCTDNDPSVPIGHELVLKDNTFRGVVNLDGWTGCWMGFIRNTVHGVVQIRNMTANTNGAENPQGPDSTEVTTNVIWGILSCSGNTPAAQFGDTGGAPNVVHGIVTGECAHMTPPTG